MGPCKFDDVNKTAKNLLDDDYQTSSFQFKTKQKTNLDGAVVTTTVDVDLKNSTVTPTKISWKIPKPLGTTFMAIDKLEMDKGGKLKFESSFGNIYPKLKVECKSDLASLNKVTAAFTFDGIKDTRLQCETKAANPADFTFEASRVLVPGVTLAVKGGAATLAAPNLGLQYSKGPYFASLLAQDKFQAFVLHGHYDTCSKVKVAGTANVGGKKNGQFGLGLHYALADNCTLKAKYHEDHIHASIKHQLRKGFNLIAGAKYNLNTQATNWGFQVSLE